MVLPQLHLRDSAIQLDQDKWNIKKAKKMEGRAMCQREEGDSSGKVPPPAPLSVHNRFGILAEALKPQRTFADYARELQESHPRPPPAAKSPLENPLSPVPGMDVVLSPEKPSTSKRRNNL